MPALCDTKNLWFDVLVVGGGAAGSCAAAAALARGAHVCLAVKGYYAQVGMRGAGASACGNTEHGLPRLPNIPGIMYQPEQMVEHAIKAGLGMADRKLVYLLAEKADDTRKELDDWGCVFSTFGAAGLGFPFVRAVEKKIRSEAVVLENTMIYDLLIRDGECIGAQGIDNRGNIVVIHAKAVILAAGGDAQLFSHNVHPSCCTGDGYAMALRAGAPLVNMEFMQIFTATVFPTRNLVHTWRAEQLEHLFNRDSQYFLEDYLPPGISADSCRKENIRHAPFSTRDAASRYLAVGIVKEILAGRGTKHGGVYLDLHHSSHVIKPAVLEFLRYKGVEPEKSPLEITMAHQCSNGGMVVDGNAMTSIPGLFGAGEAITGTHGADRIGGNMLAQCAVFGRIAGIEAAKFAVDRHKHKVELNLTGELPLIFQEGSHNASNAENIAEYRERLAHASWEHGLVLRNKGGLEQWSRLLESADKLLFSYDKATSPEHLIAALELRNLVIVGKAVCLSELGREESRGPHYREDFPHLDSQQPVAASVVNLSSDGNLRIEKKIVDPEWSDTEELTFGNMRWG